MTLVTEKEAANKWCPLARAPGGMFVTSSGGEDKRIGVTQNRGYQMGGALTNCMCIGSKCMAWRIGKPAVDAEYLHVEKSGTQTIRHAARGYCGAFGRVEQ